MHVHDVHIYVPECTCTSTKLCTIAIVRVLVNVALVAGQTYTILAVSFNVPYNSVCPPHSHLDVLN